MQEAITDPLFERGHGNSVNWRSYTLEHGCTLCEVFAGAMDAHRQNDGR
jgi:hypothetical protein